MAAYRFLGNEEVEWEDMMQPHWERTATRMQQHAVVLCIADTTELDFNGQDMEGLGPLSFEAQRGMYLHPTENGRRGGIKESTRWIEGYERVAEQAATLPATRLIYVADREGNMAALMELADTLGHSADWLIRARHNRNLAEGGKLWDKVEVGELLGKIAFILPGRAGQKARQVRQKLRASRIQLPGKRQLSVTCVVAREIDAPAGVKPVVWRLVTNRLAPDRDAVIELIDWYRARWEIDIYHAYNLLKIDLTVQEARDPISQCVATGVAAGLPPLFEPARAGEIDSSLCAP
jgi:hypothetical protein